MLCSKGYGWILSLSFLLTCDEQAVLNTIKMHEIVSVGSVFCKCMQFCNISCIHVWINIYSKIILKLLELEERCLLFSVLLSLDIIQGSRLVAFSNLLVDNSIPPKYIRQLVPYFQQTIPGSNYYEEDEFNSYTNSVISEKAEALI